MTSGLSQLLARQTNFEAIEPDRYDPAADPIEQDQKVAQVATASICSQFDARFDARVVYGFQIKPSLEKRSPAADPDSETPKRKSSLSLLLREAQASSLEMAPPQSPRDRTRSDPCSIFGGTASFSPFASISSISLSAMGRESERRSLSRASQASSMSTSSEPIDIPTSPLLAKARAASISGPFEFEERQYVDFKQLLDRLSVISCGFHSCFDKRNLVQLDQWRVEVNFRYSPIRILPPVVYQIVSDVLKSDQKQLWESDELLSCFEYASFLSVMTLKRLTRLIRSDKTFLPKLMSKQHIYEPLIKKHHCLMRCLQQLPFEQRELVLAPRDYDAYEEPSSLQLHLSKLLAFREERKEIIDFFRDISLDENERDFCLLSPAAKEFCTEKLIIRELVLEGQFFNKELVKKKKYVLKEIVLNNSEYENLEWFCGFSRKGLSRLYNSLNSQEKREIDFVIDRLSEKISLK